MTGGRCREGEDVRDCVDQPPWSAFIGLHAMGEGAAAPRARCLAGERDTVSEWRKVEVGAT